MKNLLLIFLLACGQLATADGIPIKQPTRSTAVDYEKEILPILKNNCLACHGQAKPKAGLNLETPATILKGGDAGPAVVPKKPGESLLLKTAAHLDPETIMPPKDNKVAARALTPEELGLISLWIEQGATGDVKQTLPLVWQPLPNSLNAIYSVALTENGQFAACGRANRIYLYNVAEQKLIQQLTDPKISSSNPEAAHQDVVNSLAFSADGTLLASGGFREIKLWRKQGPFLAKTIIEKAEVEAATFNAHSNVVAIATNGQITLWNHDGTFRTKLSSSVEGVAGLAFSPSGLFLAATHTNGNLRIWNITNGVRVAKTALPESPVAIGWTNESQLMVATIKQVLPISFTITNSNITVGEAIPANLELIKAVQAGGLSRDGRIITAKGDTASISKISDKKVLHELKGNRNRLLEMANKERMASLAKSEVEYLKSSLKTSENNQTNAALRHEKAILTNDLVQKVFVEKSQAYTNSLSLQPEALAGLANIEAAARQAVDRFFKASLVASTNKSEAAKTELAQAKAAFDALPKETQDKQKPLLDKIAENPKRISDAEKAYKTAELEKNNAETELTLARKALEDSILRVAATKTLVAKAETELASANKALADAKAAAEKSFDLAIGSFSPDEGLLVTTGKEGNLLFWNANSGSATDVVPTGVRGAFAVVFTAPRTVLVAGKTSVALWNVGVSWKLEKTIGTNINNSPLADRVNALRFSGDGKFLVSGGGEPSRGGEIKVWNTSSGELVRSFDRVHSDSVLSLDLSPDGKLLASGGADRFARITDFETGKLLKTLEGHTHHVTGVSWKADGRTLLTAGADNVVKAWDYTTGERRKNIEGFGKEVTSIKFLGVSDQAIVSTGEGQVVLLNEKGEKPRTYSGAADFLYSAAATPDLSIVAAGGLEGTVFFWRGTDGQLLARFPAK